MLKPGWTDGSGFLPLDFTMPSSQKEHNRINDRTKNIDKRSCRAIRRKEAVSTTTGLLEPMVKRALASGIAASCILMDSWFAFPSIIETLHKRGWLALLSTNTEMGAEEIVQTYRKRLDIGGF